MLSTALRAIRPTTTRLLAARALSGTGVVRSEGPPPPRLYGPGVKPGEVPTDFDQATGIERLQLLGELEGVAVFDKTPLDSSRIGTMNDPILVPSYVRSHFSLIFLARAPSER